MKEKPRFTIELDCYTWRCGDGCCSESGFRCETWDDKNKHLIYDNSDWSYNWYYGNLLDNALGKIKDILGRDPVRYEDYDIFFSSSDDEGSYEDNDLEWRK